MKENLSEFEREIIRQAAPRRFARMPKSTPFDLFILLFYLSHSRGIHFLFLGKIASLERGKVASLEGCKGGRVEG